MSCIRFIILDAGGVMVHPRHAVWNIPAEYKRYLGAYADDVSTERFLKICAEESVNHLGEDRYLPDIRDEYKCRYDFLKTVAERMGWDLSEEALIGLTEDFTYNFDRYVWYPDTDAVLAELKKDYTIGVLSDAMPSFRATAEDHDKDLKHFTAITISTEVGCAKPNPEMYMDILNRLNAKPEECLFVDDRAGNLEGAARMGIHAVQMCRDFEPDGSFPAVHSLEELKTYLEEQK